MIAASDVIVRISDKAHNKSEGYQAVKHTGQAVYMEIIEPSGNPTIATAYGRSNCRTNVRRLPIEKPAPCIQFT